MFRSKLILSILLILAILGGVGVYSIFIGRQIASSFVASNPTGSVVYLSHDQANSLSVAMSERATQIYQDRQASPFLLNLLPNAKNEQLYTQSLVMSFVAQQMQEANGSEGVAILLGYSADNTVAHIYVLNRSTATISSVPLEFDQMAIFYQDWLEQLVSDAVDHGTWQFADNYGAVCIVGTC